MGRKRHDEAFEITTSKGCAHKAAFFRRIAAALIDRGLAQRALSIAETWDQTAAELAKQGK